MPRQTTRRATRADADSALLVAGPVFRVVNLDLGLVGSLTQFPTGKDVDFQVIRPNPEITIEQQMAFFFNQIGPALAAAGWVVHDNPIERADGPSWFTGATMPNGILVEFYFDGPLGYDTTTES